MSRTAGGGSGPALACWLALAPAAAMPGLASAVADEHASDPPPVERSTTQASPTPPDQPGALPTPEELEAAGAVIGSITIHNGDVFDPSLPEENRPLFRLANKLHIETKPQVVRSQLLFKEGDRYSLSTLRESERILRSNNYLFDARIAPVAYRDGVVDLEVRTRDVWTLKPAFNFGRKGGKNESSFEFEESNLLGLGKQIELSHSRDVDRDSNLIRYRDPHLLGTWNRLDVAYSSNSDGKLRKFLLDRPFYSLRTPWSAGIDLEDWNRIDSRYDLGEVVDEFRHEEQTAEVFGGWSAQLSEKWIRRLTVGLTYQRDRFETTNDPAAAAVLPLDRKLIYPFVELQLLQDAYEERRNQDQIERTEDFYAGTSLRLRVGYASESLGSDRDAILLRAEASRTFGFGDDLKHTLVLAADADTRIEHGELRNAQLTSTARYYWRFSASHLFYALLSSTVSEDLDADQQILLGGDNGLRGYPLRYQDGTARALLTLEHRVYTKYYLFRLFNVGGAVFFDMGRTWGGGNAGGASQGLLKDVGLGLRLGSSRSSFGNVIHIDLAMPLDGDDGIDDLQLLVGTKRSF